MAVKVYVVVEDGLATGLAMLGLLNPVVGLHEKEVALGAVPFKVVLLPGQMVTSEPALGGALTTTAAVLVVLPQALLTVTV